MGTWPSGTVVQPGRDGATLVMVLHPRCPCSTASLDELSGLLARCGHRVATRILFAMPEDPGPDWTASSLVSAARALPGVEVLEDRGGREARRFARTSGQVQLYDGGGVLRFSGGITPGRGHQGDNEGRAAIEAILGGRTPPATSTPVFGCLLDKSDAP